LNRGKKEGYQDIERMDQMSSLWGTPSDPHSLTPLVETMKRIIEKEGRFLAEGNLLLYVITDGLNTNLEGKEDVPQMDEYLNELMRSYSNLYVTFVACAGSENLLENMDKYSKLYARVGVVDQFRVEMREQQTKHASEPGFKFTIGDLLTKLALVSLVPQVKELFMDTEEEKEDREGDSGQVNFFPAPSAPPQPINPYAQ